MNTADLMQRLSQHRALGTAPRAEHEWLVAHGSYRRILPGEVIARKTERMETLYILFEGALAIYVERGGGRRKVTEWHGGDVTGLLPYSRMITPPGDSTIEAPTEALTIEKEHFPELVRQCPVVTAALVHVMLDRARIFTSSDLHDEKMISLGRLAAGLAHELNNPASAAARSAKLLAAAMAEVEDASRAVGAAGFTLEQRSAVERVRSLCGATPSASVPSPIERADREDAMTEWLEDHNADVGAAVALADTPITFEALDGLTSILEGEQLDVALRWIAAGNNARALASDVEKASTRMHQLVTAVKGFTYMDRPTAPEDVVLGQGIADTVAVLANKARTKSASVSVELEPDLPPVRGFGGELNQVWANLIDNALDAVPESGKVMISAKREPGWVVVGVVDDGPGIPADIRGRVFDPFFTTKAVGQGTGLGLDIARRIVMRHGGEVDFESAPGRTEFRVSLPIPEVKPPAAAA